MMTIGGVLTLKDTVAAKRAGTWGAPDTDTDATSYIGRAGSLSTAEQAAYNRFIKALKAGKADNGQTVWACLDVIVNFAAPNATAALQNIRQNAFHPTNPNSCTFTAYQGYSSASSFKNLALNYTPSTARGVYVQDDAFFAVDYDYAIGNDVSYSGESGGRALQLYPRRTTGDKGRFCLNDVTSDDIDMTDGSGLIAIDRSGSSGYALYQRGVPVYKNSATTRVVTRASTRCADDGACRLCASRRRKASWICDWPQPRRCREQGAQRCLGATAKGLGCLYAASIGNAQ